MNTTEEKIMQAAMRDFAEYGFAGARIDRIAKTAKVNKAMIYYHFKDKEKLYEAILLFHAEKIAGFVTSFAPEGKADINQMYNIISKFIEYFDSLDPDTIRIILRELSSGGKYIRKIIFPKLIQPLSSMLNSNILREIDNKSIRSINPYYTLVHLIGGIIYFNIIRLTFKGTEFYDMIYCDNYLEKFSDNLIEILRYGIELKEENQ